MNEETLIRLGKHILYVGYANFMVFIGYAVFVLMPIAIIQFALGYFNIWIDVFDIVIGYVGEGESKLLGYFIWTCFLVLIWDDIRNNISVFDEA